MTMKKTKASCSVVDTFEEFNPMNPNFTKTASFDLNGLNPRLAGGQLVMEIPALETHGPMLTGEFVDTLTKAGLTMNEIETEMDNFYLSLEKKLFVKVLADRLME